MIDLSIIIISYNASEMLMNCLSSIKEQTSGLDYEIIIVDNASQQDNTRLIKNFKRKNKTPPIVLIENKFNKGFAAANNQGLEIARGDYILLLNSDTLLVENSLLAMINWLKNHKDVGICSCKLINPDGKVQPTGGYFPTLFRIFLWATFLDDLPPISLLFGSYHPHSWQYHKEFSLDWVTGAFFLFRRKVLGKIGMLDSSFFMYVEEVEYCLRAKKAGFDVFFTPQTKIIHYGGGTQSDKSYALQAEIDGLKRLYKKHYPSWQYFPLICFLFLALLLRVILFGLLDTKRGIAYAKILAKI